MYILSPEKHAQPQFHRSPFLSLTVLFAYLTKYLLRCCYVCLFRVVGKQIQALSSSPELTVQSGKWTVGYFMTEHSDQEDSIDVLSRYK